MPSRSDPANGLSMNTGLPEGGKHATGLLQVHAAVCLAHLSIEKPECLGRPGVKVGAGRRAAARQPELDLPSPSWPQALGGTHAACIVGIVGSGD